MTHSWTRPGRLLALLAVTVIALLPGTAQADGSQIPGSPLKQTTRAGDWTGGAGCCYVSVGFWRPQDGPWQASRLNSGNTEPISDRRGRKAGPVVARAKASVAETDPAAQTPQAVMGELARDLAAVKSFRYAGTVIDPTGRTRLNGVSTGQGRSRMTLRVGRQVSRMIRLPKRVYWHFNRAFVLANFDRTRSNLRNAGRWLGTSKRNAGELGIGIAESEPKRLARCLTTATGTLSHGGSATVAGLPAIVIVDRGDRPGTTPRKLYLSASLPRLPLRIVQTGKRKPGGSPDVRCRDAEDDTLRSDLRFSGFNARVKIPAPKRAIRL